MGETYKKVRQVRSDKKRDVKPFVSQKYYEFISTMSYVTLRPIKDIAEELSLRGLRSKVVIEHVSKSFKRDYYMGDTIIYIGDETLETSRTRRIVGKKSRVSMRFSQRDYEDLSSFAYALDMTIGSAASLLLEETISESQIVHSILKDYISGSLEPQRLKHLSQLYKELRKSNDSDEVLTFSHFVLGLFDELRATQHNFINKINRWIDEHID
ncbi:hypothetical protein [Pontibacillus halophilus]|uniref:hypothetical protein n=1 Tax=Pontibacillus halophilus TaxID=516704 RepID=UPI0004299CC1|nr:hypothetical protein [Pontibacillus halophilus]